ncbi:ATP-binding cassette domain-containing protein [Candidatus Micrarchaeota archaeon]|nr:ATP-binding cassette domain-containing protein [Candidatus Micrarchaeota archaeon]
MNALETKNLNFSYESGQAALFSLSLCIQKGKKTVVLGPNGAGKSTLFLHLNGVHRVQSGEVLFEGKKITYDSKSLAQLRSKVSLVFQNPDDQIFAPTVEEDVAFGPLNLGLAHEEVQKRVEESLAAVGLEEMRQRLTSALSFGQKKRVALAGALAMEPQVLIMDEPTAGLDSQMVHELLELSEELNHEGKTIVISTHDVETAYEWADEVIVLNKGKLVFSGTPDGLFSQAELLHPIGLTPPLLFQLNHQRHLRTGEPEAPRPHTIAEAASRFFQIKSWQQPKRSLEAASRHTSSAAAEAAFRPTSSAAAQDARGEKATDSANPQGESAAPITHPTAGALHAGTLHIVCVDKMAPIEPLSLKIPHENSGIYGMAAQELASRSKMHFHHRFHALEHALLKTSMGEDFVLYSDTALCSLVEKKARQFSKASGLSIPIVHLHSQQKGGKWGGSNL